MEQTQLHKEYKERVVKALMEKFGYKNVMMVPKLQKIVLSRGIGDAVSDKKLIENSAQEFALISGQKALITKAKKDVSNFKLRMGMPIGCKVTLRGTRMYEFLQRLIHVSLPRTRDFRGINATGFDGRGNYNMGIKEQIIYPEIDVDKINRISGLDITFVTSAKTDEEAFELLKELGMPFKTK